MAVIGVFILAGYAGYKLGEWLSPIIDRLGNQLWEFMWGTAQGRAQSIAAPALQAAAAYSTQLDAFMDDIEEDWPGG